ncbi:MAG TPA: SH3 domain-containing protein [Vicinamibacterales bacterium]|jgi:hypothetical protein
MLKRASFVFVLVLLLAIPAGAATVKVKVGGAVLRAAASQTAAAVQQLEAGRLLDVLDVNRDWYKVRDPQTKKEGYVLASLVEMQPGAAPTVSARTGSQPAKPGAPAAARKPAPKPGDWLDMGYFGVNGLYQGGSSAIDQRMSWTYFAEGASASIGYPAKNGPGVDVNGGYRVWRNLAVGAAVTAVSHSVPATIAGSLPNPLYLNRARTLAGEFEASHSETGIHLVGTWGIPLSPKMLLLVSGGPSVFSVKQTLAGSVGFTDVYPYDVVNSVRGNTTDASQTAWGFNLGADVGYFFTPNIGAGGLVRYARASATFTVKDATGQGVSVPVDAGGFQVGGGLRVRFGAPKPKPVIPVPPPPKPPVKK